MAGASRRRRPRTGPWILRTPTRPTECAEPWIGPPRPLRPVRGAPAHREAPAARDRVADGALTVVEGDTLWDLTAQLLGPGAADGAVCGHLASWLDHNTLAEHGDLIHPGDVLRVPPRLLDAAGSSR